MKGFHEGIIACYLYTITKHGYPPVAGDALLHLEEFSKLGFTSIELEGIREEHLDGMFAQRYALRKKADALGLKVPVFCTVLPGLCSPEQGEREENLSRFKRGCEVAVALGSKMVLDNAPIPPWQFPNGIPVTRHYDDEVLNAATIPAHLKWEVYWEELVETFREVCDIAAAHNLTYQLHPCHGALVNSTDAYLLFAEAVKRDNLKFNLDTANQYFLRDNLFLSLLRLRDHIDYIHISDNRGAKVEHLAVGDGAIHWDRFFETLHRIGYRGSFGIDIGGAESDVPDLDGAYRDAARWLECKWFLKA
ncbi:MAG: sugar phosphate isomerase/epimerase family protein [Bacteroidales bacterium]